MKDQSVFMNEKLSFYLNSEEYSSYKSLVAITIASDDLNAKYNLYCLLMNYDTEKLHTDNLSKQLRELYSSDKSINDYVNHAVFYNPKFGEISISAKSGKDMDGDYSSSISVNAGSDYDRTLKSVKEVLTMMLVETKTIP